jgi:hypothetical protein
MNVIDLTAFRQKKEKEVELRVVNDTEIDKTTRFVSSDKKDLFMSEAMRFRFQNMPAPAAFVVVDTEKMPPSFPPYDPFPTPPMAA